MTEVALETFFEAVKRCTSARDEHVLKITSRNVQSIIQDVRIRKYAWHEAYPNESLQLVRRELVQDELERF